MKVYLEIPGGNLVGCYSDTKDLNVSLLDWDEFEESNSPSDVKVSRIADLPTETVNSLSVEI